MLAFRGAVVHEFVGLARGLGRIARTGRARGTFRTGAGAVVTPTVPAIVPPTVAAFPGAGITATRIRGPVVVVPLAGAFSGLFARLFARLSVSRLALLPALWACGPLAAARAGGLLRILPVFLLRSTGAAGAVFAFGLRAAVLTGRAGRTCGAGRAGLLVVTPARAGGVARIGLAGFPGFSGRAGLAGLFRTGRALARGGGSGCGA
ncbi:hypothetical protein DA2_2474 [Desulfovibrio sp. A2]|nr:hypothetical protein DA2_2474 [Desulfovibrio sp. A2]